MDIIIIKVIEILIPICLGLIFREIGLFGDTEGHSIHKLCVRFTVPILIFFSMQDIEAGALSSMLPMMAGFVALSVLLFGIGWIGSLWIKDPMRKTAFHACIMFGNYGWLGLGVAGTLFGDNGLVRVIFFILPWWPVFYGLGIPAAMLHQHKHSGLIPLGHVSKILIPMIGMLILGLLSHFGLFSLPEVLEECLRPFAQMTIPLILLSVGMMLNLKRFHKNLLSAGVISMITLCLAPVLGWTLAILFRQQGISMDILILEASMPVATLTPVLGQVVDMDMDMVNSAIAMSTVLSMLTLPCLAAIVV
jgi:hypothetical protein